MVFFVKHVVLIFESVDKILWCDHTNETSAGVLLLMSTTHFNITRVVTKISSCRVNTTSWRGIKRLAISFGSIFLLFSNKSSRGPLS